MITFLEAEGADVSLKGEHGATPLHVAAQLGSCVVTFFSGTVKCWSVRCRRVKPLPIVSEPGGKYHRQGIHVSTTFGQAIHCSGCLQDALERTPLHVAAQFGYETIVDYLVKCVFHYMKAERFIHMDYRKGPHTLEYMSKSDYTPVEVAAFYQHPGIQQILMSRMWYVCMNIQIRVQSQPYCTHVG